jgi:methylenetetrahydrofolate dehydrogenase (NADP+)/methenyltetrahydrofolate cyclohydrolase
MGQKSSGIIVQLPLPKHLNKHRQEILNCIKPYKDIDALSDNPKVTSPVVKAVQYILKGIDLEGKSIALFGAGKLVGIPMALWLLRENATITTIHKYTKNPEYYTKKADIIISGVGIPNIVKSNMVKKGVILVDIGFSVVNNKVVGDIDKKCYNKASIVVPVPGGIGKLSLVCLLENLKCLNQ